MASIISALWLEWGLGVEGNLVLRPPEADTLAAHDAITTN